MAVEVLWVGSTWQPNSHSPGRPISAQVHNHPLPMKHHINTTVSSSLDATTQKTCSLLSCYFKNNVFFVALKQMPVRRHNQWHALEDWEGRRHLSELKEKVWASTHTADKCVHLEVCAIFQVSVLIILTPWVKVKEAMKGNQHHTPK